MKSKYKKHAIVEISVGYKSKANERNGGTLTIRTITNKDAMSICTRGLGMLLDPEDISLLGLSSMPGFMDSINNSMLSVKGRLKLKLGLPLFSGQECPGVNTEGWNVDTSI
jgi:hypothetical protein